MQAKFSLTTAIALNIFLGGVALAIFSSKELYLSLSLGWGILAIFGTCILSGRSFRHIKLSSGTETIPKRSQFPFTLFIWQMALFVLTLIGFTLVITQSQCITRLQPLEARQLFGLIQMHPFSLCIFPWLLYSVVGVGIAYFNFYKKQRPLLHHIIIPNPAHKISAFFHSIFSIINELTIAVPFLFLSQATIILLSESLCAIWGWSSPLIFSSRTVLVWFLIILFYRKRHARLMNSMQEKKMPLGNRLIIYTLILSIMLLVFQGICILMSMLMNSSMFLIPSMTKSILVGNLSAMELNLRLLLLISGWWAVWIPWMASLVAKYSEGYSVGRALLNAMLIPAVICLACTQMNINWSALVMFVQTPAIQIITALMCLAFMGISLMRVHNFTDFSQGAMLAPIPVQKYALKKVMSSFIVRLMPFLYCTYVFGWFATQVIGTLGSLFMFVLIFSFIWVLGRSASHIRGDVLVANSSFYDA